MQDNWERAQENRQRWDESQGANYAVNGKDRAVYAGSAAEYFDMLAGTASFIESEGREDVGLTADAPSVSLANIALSSAIAHPDMSWREAVTLSYVDREATPRSDAAMPPSSVIPASSAGPVLSPAAPLMTSPDPPPTQASDRSITADKYRVDGVEATDRDGVALMVGDASVPRPIGHVSNKATAEPDSVAADALITQYALAIDVVTVGGFTICFFSSCFCLGILTSRLRRCLRRVGKQDEIASVEHDTRLEARFSRFQPAEPYLSDKLLSSTWLEETVID